MPNKVQFNITEEDLAAINGSIATLQTKLLPHLATLSPGERKELPKMGNKSVSFVLKTNEYCKQNPDMVPPFLDAEVLDSNVDVFEKARTFYQLLSQITDLLWGTMLLAGSEAYSASLLFYNSVKSAKRSKIQKAETILADLAARFPKRSKKDETDQPTDYQEMLHN